MSDQPHIADQCNEQAPICETPVQLTLSSQEQVKLLDQVRKSQESRTRLTGENQLPLELVDALAPAWPEGVKAENKFDACPGESTNKNDLYQWKGGHGKADADESRDFYQWGSNDAAGHKSAQPYQPYLGEDIHRNIERIRYVPKDGETLTDIARNHLGYDATPDQIGKYATEIARANSLDPHKSGKLEARELVLPGHTVDGGFIEVVGSGATRISWKDGSRKEEFFEGGGYESHPSSRGGYIEKYWGPPEDKFELEKTADGTYFIAAKPGDQPREVPPASDEVRDERKRLEELAESKILYLPHLVKFRADMLRFEMRATQQDPPLTPQEVAQTYRQIERLLSAGEVPSLAFYQTEQLAMQVMSQAATPAGINQGSHHSCSVAAVEARTYTRTPCEAARLVADVATTGKYKSADGTEVILDPACIRSIDLEAQAHPPKAGERSHASQIFQLTAANVYHQSHDFSYSDADGKMHHIPAGKLKYVQIDVHPGTIAPDTGERLLDTSTDPPTTIMADWSKNQPITSPALSDSNIVYLSNQISGKDDTVVLAHESFSENKQGVQSFKNEQDLKDQIAKAKADRKLPIIMQVHTGEEPFLHDSGSGAAGGSGGWHVVTITGYDEQSGAVAIDNQWGSSYDHMDDGKQISVNELFLASRPPDYKETTFGWETGGTKHDLQKDIEQDRSRDFIDTRKELELLRLEQLRGELSDKDYTDKLKVAMDDANERWEKQKVDGDFNRIERDNAIQKFKDMTQALPPEQRMDVLQREYRRQLITSREYDTALIETFFAFGIKEPAASAQEKSAFAERYKQLLTDLPEDRRAELVQKWRVVVAMDKRLQGMDLQMLTMDSSKEA